MKYSVFILYACIISLATKAQVAKEHLRYTDFHIHPTYKHYFRYPTAAEMKLIYQNSGYNREKDSIVTDTGIRNQFKDTNWGKVLGIARHLRAGKVSDLKNYDQSGYPEIKFVPGSILCNSYSPYEKQFAFSCLNRWFSHKVVTKMGKKRLKEYSLPAHSPFRDFLAEYYYNCMQEESRTIHNYIPGSIYNGEVNGNGTTVCYTNQIQMVGCSDELKAIIKHNDSVYSQMSNPVPGSKYCVDTPKIITPLLMSVEGGQVLYDSLTALEQNIFRPGYLSEPEKKYRKKDPAPADAIRNELLKNADSLRNLKHRLFFITLGHFAQNHVVGFAKTLDRDPENWIHRAISTLTSIPAIKRSILKKDYDGFNLGCSDKDKNCEPDSIGFRIMEKFLNPQDGRCNKPTYIDVKHMDILGRYQYYAVRRSYVQKFKVQIPIIASHFAVSGESQGLAAATGLGKNADGYSEIINPLRIYRKIQRNQPFQKKKLASLETPDITQAQQQQSRFNKSILTPIQFENDTLRTALPENPFTDIEVDESKVGWYYPWSINLYDEEIIEINKSDGIIGLLMDPRQLGAFMHRYKKIEKANRMGLAFDSTVRAIPDDTLAQYGFSRAQINKFEYFKTEPLIRNMFYIVQVINRQMDKEDVYYASGDNAAFTKTRYRDFVSDEQKTKKDPWTMIAIGGDYDGLIDPIDVAPTASYIPHLRSRLVLYAYIFAQMRKNEFWDTRNYRPFIISLHDSAQKMKQFFYENGKNFILKYF
jgi:hypothetical protein